jgi:hypothetical protein
MTHLSEPGGDRFIRLREIHFESPAFLPLPLPLLVPEVGGCFSGSIPLVINASTINVSTRLLTVRFSESAHVSKQFFISCSQVNITRAFLVAPPMIASTRCFYLQYEAEDRNFQMLLTAVEASA